MDQIERALEKAKRSRRQEPAAGGADQKSHVRSRSATDRDSDGTKASLKPPKQEQPHSIRFEKTKVIPVSERTLKKRRVIAGLKQDPRAAVFQLLRTQVLTKLRRKKMNVLAITSPLAETGKTVIAANLAMSIAQDVNQTVLVADLDLRRPNLAQTFGLKPDAGLLDYLTEKKELSEVLVNPGQDRLVLLPGKGAVPDSSEVLSAPRTVSLLHEMKERYPSRIVICDLPPLLPTDDALVALQQIDAVMLVVEDGKTTEEELRRSLDLLHDCELLGVVMNKSDSSSVDPYYY